MVVAPIHRQRVSSAIDSSTSSEPQCQSKSTMTHPGGAPRRSLFFWKCVKSVLNFIAFLVGLFSGPFSKKGYIPWPSETSIADTPVSELVDKIKKGQLKSTSVVQFYINRIHQVNPHVNAVVHLASERAIEEASKVDQEVLKILKGEPDADLSILEKPLLGIPFTCKDSIGVKDMIQSSGCTFRKNVLAEEDADVITQLRKSGGIPLCITNVPEILLWWESSNLLYGTTNNPYDLSRTTGGSSGGEAALIACCASPIGLGSDMGGSIRIPSFYCGVFGHKTTSRIISTKGMWPPVSDSLDQYVAFGPMARRVADLKLMFKSMLKDEGKAKLKLDQPVDLSKINLLWMDDEGGNPLFSPIESEILNALYDSVSALERKHGLSGQKVSFARMINTMEMWAVCIRNADRRTVTELINEVSGSQIKPGSEIVKSMFGYSKHSFNLCFLAFLQVMMTIPDDSKAFVKLAKMTLDLRDKFIEKLGPNGVLICPTMPQVAPKHSTTPFKGTDTTFAALFNILELPVTQVPIKITSSGLPIGLQVVSAPLNDNLCLEVAASLEEIFGGYKRP